MCSAELGALRRGGWNWAGPAVKFLFTVCWGRASRCPWQPPPDLPASKPPHSPSVTGQPARNRPLSTQCWPSSFLSGQVCVVDSTCSLARRSCFSQANLARCLRSVARATRLTSLHRDRATSSIRSHLRRFAGPLCVGALRKSTMSPSPCDASVASLSSRLRQDEHRAKIRCT